MPALPWRNVHWLWLSAAVIVLDQVTKQLVAAQMYLFESIHLTGFLNLTYMHNTGAAFSMLAGAPSLLFVALGVIVTIAIMVWLHRHPRAYRGTAIALALILGGALGNVIDRVTRGYVIDFIDVHAGHWHWPAFNVADSAITIGAILLILGALLVRRRVPAD
jgi:signal peptidase II